MENEDDVDESESKRCSCGIFFDGPQDKCSKCRGEPVIYLKEKPVKEDKSNQELKVPLTRKCKHEGCTNEFEIKGARSPRWFCDEHNVEAKRAKKSLSVKVDSFPEPITIVVPLRIVLQITVENEQINIPKIKRVKSSSQDQAMEALLKLGYKSKKIKEVWSKLTLDESTTVEQWIKATLKELSVKD